MPWSEDDLRRAGDHILQALDILTKQKQVIEELQKLGKDTGNAEELLRSLQKTLAVLRRHRTVIQSDLKAGRREEG